MRRIRPLDDNKVLRPAESALALNLLSEMELLKLKTVARLQARGLPPDVSWEDILQEALTRVLVGSRVKPADVSMVWFVAGVMRSLRSEHWRRTHARAPNQTVPLEQAGEDSRELQLRDPAPTPEHSLIALQELAAIRRLFAQDLVCLKIIQGLEMGLTAEQLCSAHGIARTDYDSARKRMRRTLIKEGLTCGPK
jgi:DNA-directed RNA polymerase specialized sigma24 family protein